ncbi:MAG: transglutaminase domain-containing protein [Desulfobacterales bacterium]|jgi:hypothetical protein
MKVATKQSILIAFTMLILSATLILSYHDVDNSLTEEDRQYIPLYLRDVAPLPENPSYLDELNFIISVQLTVLKIAPRNEGLPFGQKREPKELYEAKSGWCYDRSRVIEKILRFSGFETRHIFIFSTEKNGSTILSLMTPDVASHAVTEVLTRKGWLIVDSNAPWVSTDKNNQPLSIGRIQRSIDNAVRIDWHKEPPADIYTKPFASVFGLYSRHGLFYPPYNFIPDINYDELIQNVLPGAEPH